MPLFADPTLGSVAPLVLLMREGGLVDSGGDEYQISGWAMNRGHRRALEPSLLQVAEVFGASACAAFDRREALRRAGRFPEHFGAYYDDVDLAFRLRAALAARRQRLGLSARQGPKRAKYAVAKFPDEIAVLD